MQEHASVSSILPFIHLLFPYSIHVVSCFVQEFYDYSIELVNAPIFNLVLHIDYKASPSGNIADPKNQIRVDLISNSSCVATLFLIFIIDRVRCLIWRLYGNSGFSRSGGS